MGKIKIPPFTIQNKRYGLWGRIKGHIRITWITIYRRRQKVRTEGESLRVRARERRAGGGEEENSATVARPPWWSVPSGVFLANPRSSPRSPGFRLHREIPERPPRETPCPYKDALSSASSPGLHAGLSRPSSFIFRARFRLAYCRVLPPAGCH